MSIKDILDAIEAVEATPIGRSIELRMSFSRLVAQRLRELGLTQKKLADKAKKKESYISRVLSGDENCSFDRLAEILFALNTEAEFEIVRNAPEPRYCVVVGSNGTMTTGRMSFKRASNGHDKKIEWACLAGTQEGGERFHEI